MKNNIYRSAALVTVFSTIEKTLSFIYRIVLSRTIGAEGVGIYQICLSVFAVFLTAASSGIPITVSRIMAKHSASGNIAAKHGAVSSGIALTLMFTVPVALVLFLAKNLYGFLFPDENCLNIFLWLLPGLILTSVYAVMRGSFWGNKQFLSYSAIELAENSVMVIVGCILIGFAHTPEGGAEAAIIAVLVSYIFSFAASLIWYRVNGGKFVDPRPQLKPLLSSAMPITVMRTSTSLLNSVIAMFLPALLMSACGYTDSEAVALYGVVMGMSLPMLFTPNSLIGSIAVVVSPELSEDFYADRKENLKRDIERTLRASVLIAAVLIPVMFTLGETLGIFFFDNEFSESVGMTLLGKEVAEGFVDLMSPDNTSEGNLVKMWRIVDGVRCLYKGGSVPFCQEPYNEVVATMVMDRLGIDNAGYSLGWIDGDPYSVCPDFVDRDTELVTMAYVMYASRWCGTAYRTCVNACSEVGIDVVPFLDRMIVTDFLLANEDRHLYNLGLIRDAGTLEFIGPAPIYDCGSSLGYNRDVPDMAVAAEAACKPFAESFEKELDLVTDFGWVDADGLDGALQEARAFLLECEGLDPERADAMSGTIEVRIEALRSRL